jgi:hypothetical protein
MREKTRACVCGKMNEQQHTHSLRMSDMKEKKMLDLQSEKNRGKHYEERPLFIFEEERAG